MSFPKSEQIPDDAQQLPPARRRRAKRLLVPFNGDQREAFLDDIAQQTSLSFDFFLFSILAGLTIGVGLWIDAPALLVLGALLAPTMSPLVGIALGAISGSMRFFTRSLLGFSFGSLLVLLAGLLIGALTKIDPLPPLIQVYFHTQLAWHHFLVVAIGSALTSVAIVRSKRRTAIASVALAYELYTPIAAAGFGLTSGAPDLWPDGLVVFGIHLAWAIIISVITLILLGFRPLTLFGYTLGGTVALLSIIVLIGVSSAGYAVGGQVALPTLVPSATSTPTITPTLPPTNTATSTPTGTMPPTLTASTTPVPSLTPLPSPIPVYAIINAPEEYGGAILRDGPSFSNTYIVSVANGTLIQILSDKPVVGDKVLWHHVRIPDGREGWMIQSAILAATPVPNW
ncbi:MAG: DUF389 domain-containing protein [Chloroflexota bacterium]